MFEIGTVGLTATDQGVAVVNVKLQQRTGQPDQGLAAAHARQRPPEVWFFKNNGR